MIGPLSAQRDGSLRIRLAEIEADAIRSVAADVAAALEEPEQPHLRRLFPPAYPDDRDRQQEFEMYTRDDLLARKRAAAAAVVASVDAGERKRGRWTGTLDRDTVHAWVATINDARLALGTRLDVGEDDMQRPLPAADARAPAFNLYLYLGGIEELLVEYLLEHDVADG